jgi:hypothetical protein
VATSTNTTTLRPPTPSQPSQLGENQTARNSIDRAKLDSHPGSTWVIAKATFLICTIPHFIYMRVAKRRDRVNASLSRTSRKPLARLSDDDFVDVGRVRPLPIVLAALRLKIPFPEPSAQLHRLLHHPHYEARIARDPLSRLSLNPSVRLRGTTQGGAVPLLQATEKKHVFNKEKSIEFRSKAIG